MTKFIFNLIILYLSSYSIIYPQTQDAEVINYQTEISYKRETLFKNTSCEIKINNRCGDDYTKVTIPFSKLNKVGKIEASVKDLNGNIIKKLNSSDISEHSDFATFSFYEDNMVKEFTLKHNLYPYILNYSYQERMSQFLIVNNWCPVLNWKIPTNNASLTVELPKNYSINFRNILTTNVKIDSFKDEIRYSWQATYAPIEKPEIYMPVLNQYFPQVEIVPENFTYDIKGSFKDWISYGNWQYNIIQNLTELPLPEKEKIVSLTSGFRDKKEKIKVLYHYLQDETRYVNISIKTGGMKPFPASFVSEKKYGDCKALAIYMKAMLSHIGIPSYYTKVYADDAVKNIDKSFPYQQFNHVILNIPLETDTIWLDCTSDGPFNYLGTFTQNRDAFLVEKDNSHFIRTPALKPENMADIRKVTFSENSANEIIAEFENTYRSENFMHLFSINRELNESMKNQFIHEKFIEKGFEPVDFRVITSPRDSAFIRLKYNASTNRIINQYGNEEIIRLLSFDIPEFNKPANRKYAVQLDFPIYKSDTLDYLIPSGLTIKNKPINQTIESEFGKYSIKFISTDIRLRVIKSFCLYAGNYPLKQYPPFYDFIKKVTDLEKNTLMVINKHL